MIGLMEKVRNNDQAPKTAVLSMIRFSVELRFANSGMNVPLRGLLIILGIYDVEQILP